MIKDDSSFLSERMNLENVEQCLNCGAEEKRLWCRTPDRQFGSQELFEYSICLRCKLKFQTMRPSAADIAVFYPKHYLPYATTGQNNKPQHKAAKPLVKIANFASRPLSKAMRKISPDLLPARLAQVYSPSGDGATLLDFGCGSAHFLNDARERGWNTRGMDFSPDAVEKVCNEGHRAMLVSDQAWDEIEDCSLDCIRLNHVLEHLYQPRKDLEKLRSKLKKGGTIHLALPNAQGISARCFKTYWHGLDAPRHISFYSPKLLRAELTQLGFGEIQIYYQRLTKDMTRSYFYWRRDGVVDSALLDRKSNADEVFYLEPLAIAAAWMKIADHFHVIARAV